jgi:hypothetical protein
MLVLAEILILLAKGIPGIVVAGAALVLMIIGLVRKESWMMVVAALLSIPSAYLLGSWSGILLAVRLMPILQLLTAFFIEKDEMILAWIFPIPSFGMLIYFIFNLVVKDFTGF